MVKEWRQDKYRTKLSGKVLFVTCESDCYEITSQTANIIHKLNSTQDEADTKLILHAAHAAEIGLQGGGCEIRRNRRILALSGV